MKNRWWFGILTSLAAGIALAAPPARAQFEIDPDHFDSPSMVHFDHPRTEANSEGAVANVHYEGRFTLPDSVQCNGERLCPGKYSISLRADGKIGQATLNQKNETIGIGVVAQKQARRAGGDALVVELNRGTRKLSEIQIAHLDLILDSRLSIASTSDSKPKRIARLLLTESTHKRVRPRHVPDSRNTLSLVPPKLTTKNS